MLYRTEESAGGIWRRVVTIWTVLCIESGAI